MDEARKIICMVNYYRDMWTGWSHILAPMTEADIGPKGRKILWNDVLEESFKEIKNIVSADTLLSYPYLKSPNYRLPTFPSTQSPTTYIC